MTTYRKLVRDNIPDIIAKHGKCAITRVLTIPEYRVELGRKLLEEAAEVNELVQNDDRMKLAEEIADLVEVAHALATIHNITPAEIHHARFLKILERGGFEKRIFLEKTEARQG